MRLASFILAGLVFAAILALPAAAAPGARVNVQAILVAAGKEPGPIDPRLAPYEDTLRRILRFESFRFLGQGSAALNQPGEGTLPLAQGHTLQLQAATPGDDGLRLQVAWADGRRQLMRTGLALRPGVPAVLGGPAHGQTNEVLAVILIAR